MHSRPSSNLRIGVSACLLGEPVRFNGGHAKDRFVVTCVAQLAELVPVCPELEAGMGAPRDPVRLRRADGLVQLVNPKSGEDWTSHMARYAESKARELQALDLSGFIFKKDSPSCGMERVKVYDENGVPSKNGRGLFAAVLIESNPLLPVEEEGRLNDYRLRENFFERVFAYRRLRNFFSGPWTAAGLIKLHTAEKLLVLSHDPHAHGELGWLVARAAGMQREIAAAGYQRLFMAALSKQASAKRQANVLLRAAGYFKGWLSAGEKNELLGLVEDFRSGLVPLAVPLTLVRHYVSRFDAKYIAAQTYLEPHPKSLMLRSFV